MENTKNDWFDFKLIKPLCSKYCFVINNGDLVFARFINGTFFNHDDNYSKINWCCSLRNVSHWRYLDIPEKPIIENKLVKKLYEVLDYIKENNLDFSYGCIISDTIDNIEDCDSFIKNKKEE